MCVGKSDLSTCAKFPTQEYIAINDSPVSNYRPARTRAFESAVAAVKWSIDGCTRKLHSTLGIETISEKNGSADDSPVGEE
jgi:hypothetical protein